MAALISLLFAIAFSLLITRIAAEALVLTGLSRQSAQFQARSAFTGAGFTTSESERVVSHPMRRRILMWLMLLGNAGVVTVISSLVLTFISTAQPLGWLSRILILIFGLGLLWILAVNRKFNRYLTRWVKWGLKRWTRLDVKDYANLLQLQGEYQVKELQVESQDWLASKQLKETRLRDEGVLVLGIVRANGKYLGAPKGFTEIRPGDILILYGRSSAIEELDYRSSGFTGELAHRDAVARQEESIAEENKQDLESN